MIDQPCPEWEQHMVAALAGDLGQQTRDQLERHVETCDECRDAWDCYRRADEALEACCTLPPALAASHHAGPALLQLTRPVAVATLAASPIGPLQVAVTSRGLCRVHFGDDRAAFEAALLEAGYGPLVDDPELTAGVLEQLAAYFAGQRTAFDLPVDLSSRSPFEREVLRATASVPSGALTTYSQVAAMIGRPRAYRAVGNALRRNPVPVVIPCHRVISTDGSLRGYAGGLGTKGALLRLEGALAS